MGIAALLLAIAGLAGPGPARAQSAAPGRAVPETREPAARGEAAAKSGAEKARIRLPTNTRDILVDPMTGLALLGYDPVAYFVDRKPRLGVRKFELLWSGVVWRFVNEGNMAAFEAAPDVYAPQYGGYDPLALASGSMTHGDPAIWLIYKQRLYLFFAPSKRFLWLSAAEQNLAAAERFWNARAR